MRYPTVNLVSGRPVACYKDKCDIYQEGHWQHLQNTKVLRTYHSSAATKDAVLLIGGESETSIEESETSTEWIPMDGSPAQPGPFAVRHGYHHCTIQISEDMIVVTGGYETGSYVTQFDLVDGNETPLRSLGKPRYNHACGVYQDAGGQQVSRRLSS